ncbi:MAG TPA: hypothetical protein VNX00_03410 [Herbaspirillum sp.]|jgi:hypothetical protein|nr:hypothetical protein [Herbaspirillum sp.]
MPVTYQSALPGPDALKLRQALKWCAAIDAHDFGSARTIDDGESILALRFYDDFYGYFLLLHGMDIACVDAVSRSFRFIMIVF